MCACPYMYKNFSCVLVYPCSGLVASPIVTPPSCCSTAGRPTLPSCHWGSPWPLGLAELAFWALPHQSSLAAAALSCALADGIGVGQSHSSCDCVWGRWGEDEEVARRSSLNAHEFKWSRTVSNEAVKDLQYEFMRRGFSGQCRHLKCNPHTNITLALQLS